MESEKVKEIKKALELNEYYAIEYFPKSGEPKIFTFTDILTLINELESENERLSDDLKFQQMTDKTYKYNMACENGKQFKQISELKEENTKLKDRIDELETLCNKTYEDLTKEIDRLEKEKTEQLKQFAERLKEKFDEQKHFYETASISHRDISLTALYTAYKYLDETLKEYEK